jgi:hypothetical protein
MSRQQGECLGLLPSHQDPDYWLVMPPNRVLRTDYPWSLSSNVPWCANQTQKIYRIWTPSAGSYQVRDWDAVTNYWDRINWHALNRNEILTLEKARTLGGEPLLYIDPADLFRVFGGKYIIFDWMRDQ